MSIIVKKNILLFSVLILQSVEKEDDLQFKTLKITDFGLARESKTFCPFDIFYQTKLKKNRKKADKKGHR